METVVGAMDAATLGEVSCEELEPTTERTPSTRYRMAMTSSADDDYFTRRSCSVYLRAQQLMKLLLAVLILSRGFTHTLTQLL